MKVRRSFDVRAKQTAVVQYLMDFTHAEQWDPGTRSCTRLDEGPIGVGSRWLNESEFLGRMTQLEYGLVEHADDRVVFRGINKTVTSTDDIAVTALDAGCRIEYVATLKFHGLARLAGPVLKIALERLGNQTEQQMSRVLDGLGQ